MGRFRPRSNATKRIIGKAVGKGLREYNRGKTNKSMTSSDNSVGIVIFVIILFLVILVQCGG